MNFGILGITYVISLNVNSSSNILILYYDSVRKFLSPLRSIKIIWIKIIKCFKYIVSCNICVKIYIYEKLLNSNLCMLIQNT